MTEKEKKTILDMRAVGKQYAEVSAKLGLLSAEKDLYTAVGYSGTQLSRTCFPLEKPPPV